ncbi:MAG: hypothetical protein WEC34_07600 [Acidimicrobiia bacterium]
MAQVLEPEVYRGRAFISVVIAQMGRLQTIEASLLEARLGTLTAADVDAMNTALRGVLTSDSPVIGNAH